MIAEFNSQGNLPPGIHAATWQEISERFGSNHHRKEILRGLKRALYSLKSSGCKKVFLDGSFITSKNIPGDFDGCWDPENVDLEKLDPILKDVSSGRKAQKAKYSGEFFISDSSGTMLDFFQQDKETGDPKGIISLNLEYLS